MAERTHIDPKISPPPPTSIVDRTSPSPLKSSSSPHPDLFSNLTKSKLYDLVPPPLKTAGLPPLFSISSFRGNGNSNNVVPGNPESTNFIDGNKYSLFDSSSLFPKLKSFDFNIPDLNSILADKVEEWVAQHTRALILGVGLGAAVSVGVGVGLLSIGFPHWCGEIYKRGRRWLVESYHVSLTARYKSDVDGYEIKETQNGEVGESENTDLESNSARGMGTAQAQTNRMIQSSSEEDSEVTTHKNTNKHDETQTSTLRGTNIAILGLSESSSSSPSSSYPKRGIMIIQGNPTYHQTSSQSQQEQHVNTKDQSITQCQECLDSITVILAKNMLTWKNVGRISAHLVLGKCSGATFRSVLSKYPISIEGVITTVYYVQCLEDSGACAQVEVLASI